MEGWRTNRRAFWTFFLPPTAWLVLFFLAPLALIWAFSFGEKRGLVEIAINGTLENYVRALDPLYLRIFGKSFWYAALTTLICLAVGLPVAVAITFAPGRWKPVLLLLTILPFWTNLLIRTYALIAVLRTRGYVNFTAEWVWKRRTRPSRGSGSESFTSSASASSRSGCYTTTPRSSSARLRAPPLHGAAPLRGPRPARPLLPRASLDLGASQIRTFASVVVPSRSPESSPASSSRSSPPSARSSPRTSSAERTAR